MNVAFFFSAARIVIVSNRLEHHLHTYGLS